MKLSVIFKPKPTINNGPNDLLFVEVNDENGNSIDAGEWLADGEHETLTIDCAKHCEVIDAKHLEQLDNCTAIAISPGNADVNDYLRGMANGLLLAQSIFKGGEPKYIHHPDEKLSRSRVMELYHYASSYETLDENTPNGTPCQHGGIPMNDARRAAIIAYKKVLGLLPENYVTTIAAAI